MPASPPSRPACRWCPWPTAASSKGLFGTIGYDRTVDCTSETAEAIEEKVRAAWAERESLRRETEAACRRGLDKLAVYETRLREILDR